MKKSVLAALVLGASLAVTGCFDKQETAQKVEAAKDATANAATQVKDAAKEVATDVKNAATDAMNSAKEAATNAKDVAVEKVEEAKDAVEHGCKELQVTAQDTACFGMDTGESFADLLNKLGAIEGDFRIRVGMMNPQSIKNQLHEVIDAFKNNDKIFNFVHLPIQSGSPKVLKEMNRNKQNRNTKQKGNYKYQSKQILERI